MRIVTLLIGVFLLPGYLIGQSQGDVMKERYNDALWYLRGVSKPYYPEKGLGIMHDLAEDSYPKAMNALGIMYSKGMGTKIDYQTSLQWFIKASEAGYLKAYHNIGLMYKYGYGVKSSFSNAMNSFLQGAELGDPDCMYSAGYMYYKGLGCKQDYKKALEFFFRAAELSNSGATYMIGLCYRNGYGVEQNEEKAIEWLKLSSASGNLRANIELSAECPENSISKGKIVYSRAYDVNIPQAFVKVAHDPVNQFHSGTYEGYIITYDWSGTNVINISPLILELQRNDYHVTGQWIEADTLRVGINAHLSDTTLAFIDVEYQRGDHYSVTPFDWEFTDASVNINYSDSMVYLTGNLQMFSPLTMEPERPRYISLISVLEKNHPEKYSGIEPINSLVVFPNPFSEQLNLSFELLDDAEIFIKVQTVTGNLVYEAKCGKLLTGTNVVPLPVSLTQGLYIVTVSRNNFSKSATVVKR